MPAVQYITTTATDTFNMTNVSPQSPLPVQGAAGTLPPGATAVNGASGNVAAASAVATLPAVASKTNYITGFQITAAGATAASVVSVTVAGLISGTATYTFVAPAGATVQATPLIVSFGHPIPASAVNTAITVTCPSLGTGNTNATANVQGYVV